ncbi:MAG: ROK family protein [Phycisphaerales bacterium]
MPTTRIGVDLGGTKIEAIALVGGEIVARERVATPAGDYDKTLTTISSLVDRIAHDARAEGLTTVGVGTPGSVDRATGLHRNSNSICLNDRPFESDLNAIIRFPVRTANDANCFALSEAADGAAAGHRVVFGVILGTGVGGGVVIDGVVHEGGNGLGGEWGHIGLPHRDARDAAPRPCYCGRSDCLEQYLSGPAIEAEYAAASGMACSLAEIAASVDADEHARAVINRFHDRLAESLVTVVDLLDPQAIVLGGGVSNLDSIYEVVPQLVHARAFGGSATTPILRNVHGDSSGVRGAAWLWPDA